ncbi:MAG TPA: hypothetical protein VKS21_06520 [Spirochaetota bacterium]|nr:hypothetical protein [Spirochaetota bacterium]
MDFKAIPLFKALQESKIDDSGGYISTGRFSPNSIYAVFKTIKFKNIKGMSFDDEEAVFNTDGKMLYFLYEPRTYLLKHVEPVHRKEEEAIPYRFSECTKVLTNENDKIFFGKKPKVSYKTFTVSKPRDQNFAYYFPFTDKDVDTILEVYKKIFTHDYHLTESKTKTILIHIKKLIELLEKI